MRGGIYMVSRQGLGIGLKLIGVMLITRVLQPTAYGSYVAAYNVYLYATLLGQVGMGVFLVRHPGHIDRRVIGTAYTLLAGVAVALFLALETSSGLMTHMTGVAGYGAVMRIMAIGILFQFLAVPAVAQIERALEWRKVAIVEIGGDVAYYAIAAPLALSGAGAVSLGCALVLQQGLFCILAHHYARRGPVFAFDRSVAREVLHYAGTFSLANWIWQMRMLINPLVVGPVGGAKAVGIVGMTIGILEMLSITKTIAWRLIISVLGRVQGDRAKLRKSVTEGMELQILAVGATLLGFAWFGGIAVPLVFGARWLPVMTVYPFVAVAYLSIATFNAQSAVMSVIARNRDLALCYIVHIALLAGGAWLAVRQVGPVGYGIGEMIALPSYLLLHHALARQIGSPDYRLAALWYGAAVIGFFWQTLGLWAIAVPFAALALPVSQRKLRAYIRMARKPKSQAPFLAEAA